MLFTTLQVGETEYKLRMQASRIIDLEKKLGGRNPLSILSAVESGEMPSLSSLLLILHASLQKFHHGKTFEDVLTIYDDYVDAGNTYTDLMPVMMEAFRVSGFFKGASQEAEAEKASQ